METKDLQSRSRDHAGVPHRCALIGGSGLDCVALSMQLRRSVLLSPTSVNVNSPPVRHVETHDKAMRLLSTLHYLFSDASCNHDGRTRYAPHARQAEQESHAAVRRARARPDDGLALLSSIQRRTI